MSEQENINNKKHSQNHGSESPEYFSKVWGHLIFPAQEVTDGATDDDDDDDDDGSSDKEKFLKSHNLGWKQWLSTYRGDTLTGFSILAGNRRYLRLWRGLSPAVKCFSSLYIIKLIGTLEVLGRGLW